MEKYIANSFGSLNDDYFSLIASIHFCDDKQLTKKIWDNICKNNKENYHVTTIIKNIELLEARGFIFTYKSTEIFDFFISITGDDNLSLVIRCIAGSIKSHDSVFYLHSLRKYGRRLDQYILFLIAEFEIAYCLLHGFLKIKGLDKIYPMIENKNVEPFLKMIIESGCHDTIEMAFGLASTSTLLNVISVVNILPVNKDLIASYNTNPFNMKKKMIKKHNLISPEAMIFAMIIFTCDDFLKVHDD